MKNSSKIKPLTREHFLTHMPKHPLCPTCQRCKAQRSPCKKKAAVDHSAPPPKEFNDALTCDWGVMTERCKARNEEIDQLLIIDRASHWKHVHASETRHTDEVVLLGFNNNVRQRMPSTEERLFRQRSRNTESI